MAMSFTGRPEVFQVRAPAPRSGSGRFRRLGLILLGGLGVLMAGMAPADAPPGIVPATKQFEVPQESDSYRREEMQRLARENTEQFRVRITLPAAAFESPPAKGPTKPANGSGGAAASVSAPPGGETGYALEFVWFFLGLVVWLLIARKLAPEVTEHMTEWLRSRALWRSVPTKQLVALLAEEEAVAEFQAALRAGGGALGPSAAESAAEGKAEGNPFPAAAGHFRELHRLLGEAARTEATVQRRFLVEALERIQSLKSLAGPAELLPLRQMTGGVEMLLKQLTEKSSNVTASTLRTTTLAVTLIEELCHPGLRRDLLSEPPLRLLAVDDEMFSRFALCNSLKRGLAEPDVAENGPAALSLASRHAYDLIVLDVQMPGMDGFELCAKIHEAAPNRTTPVVFVTSLRDFEARANSILCGGRDLIAKPFLTFELAVKALTLVAGERLQGRGRLAAVCADPAGNDAPAATPMEAGKAEAGGGVGIAKPEAAPVVESPRLPLVPATVAGRNWPARRPESAAGFYRQARAQIDGVQQRVELAVNTPDRRVQQEIVTDLFLGVHSLAVSAEGSGQPSLAMTAAALEGLLKKLLENPANLSASTLQSVATAAALLQELCTSEADPALALAPPIRALLADDDPVALRAVSNALQRTFSKPENAADGKSALALAEKMPFDVIFLDVQMPDLDGFEVCAGVRQTAANRLTPVVFLTGFDNPALRARSEVCGGSDLLTKPCLASELNLKALVFALRGRLRAGGEKATLRPAGVAAKLTPCL
jgi:CheY-like chemotaxis protein